MRWKWKRLIYVVRDWNSIKTIRDIKEYLSKVYIKNTHNEISATHLLTLLNLILKNPKNEKSHWATINKLYTP